MNIDPNTLPSKYLTSRPQCDSLYGMQLVQKASGVPIQHQRGIGMETQDRRWRHRVDFTSETATNGICLARFRRDAKDRTRLQDLINRHRHRPSRHFIQARKPPLSHLLSPPRFRQFDGDEWFPGFEVRRRIIKGQMSVFSDADDGQVDGSE